MLFELQDGAHGDTKIDEQDLTKYATHNRENNKTDIRSQSFQSLALPMISNKQRVTTKVLSSKGLLEHIISYIPIESLCSCIYVNHDWYLIIKYIVPIPLIHLRLLAMGELLYWLPGENQFPKTVLLKLRFSSGIPKFIQISTSINNQNKKQQQHAQQQQKQHKNGYHLNGITNTNIPNSTASTSTKMEIVSSSGHYQMLELSEILFVIDGHWTPIFDQLNATTAQESFQQDESQFFHRSKCFSIVTNTYMTYDFIAFNAETNKCIVNTLRSIIHQTRELSSKMAIHAKANKKYYDALNQTPLIFKDTLSALKFEMFVLILQDCLNKIGSELNIDIPSVITTEANASLLYPMIIEENIPFSDWYPWVRLHIFDTLKSYGYIKQIDDNINANNEYGIINDEVNETKSNSDTQQNGIEHSHGDNDDDEDEVKINENQTENVEVLYDAKKHKRQSSLFGVKAFPTDETYDLFAGIRNSDDEEEMDYHEEHHMDMNANNVLNVDGDHLQQNDPNCIVM